jgi:hypothetical protein
MKQVQHDGMYCFGKMSVECDIMPTFLDIYLTFFLFRDIIKDLEIQCEDRKTTL